MTKSINELPVVDWGQASELAPNIRELTNELLVMFAQQAPEVRTAINQAVSKQDCEELNDVLHKLQGGCVYCGLLRLKAAIAEVTKFIRETNSISQALVDNVISELEVVMAELRNKGIIKN